jgi:plasmid stabilization system protein ParE
MRRLRISAQVRADVLSLADYIAIESPDNARRFLGALYSTWARLLEYPLTGRECEFGPSHLIGLRWIRVQGFPNHLVFYIPDEGQVRIVRVLHGSRDRPRLFSDDDTTED